TFIGIALGSHVQCWTPPAMVQCPNHPHLLKAQRKGLQHHPGTVALQASLEPSVVSLDSVDEFEQARSEDVRYTLLMHDTRFASGGSYGVHHMLLSAPTMHTLRPTRLWHSSGPLWSRSRHSSTAVHQVSGHVFGAPGHGVL